MDPNVTSRPRASLLSILVFGFLLASLCAAQGASDKRAVAPGPALDEQVAQTHASIRQVAATTACTNGSATLGVQVSGSLTATDCTSTDSNGTLYAHATSTCLILRGKR